MTSFRKLFEMSGKLDGMGWKNAVNLMGIQSPPGRALGLKDKNYNKRLEGSKASVDSVGTKKATHFL